MENEIVVNDQVMYRKPIRNGILIRIGSVVSINASGDVRKAKVNFPIDHTSVEVPVAQLEKTSTRFSGFARVQPSLVQRSIR